jgi:predicted MFS family arabinose efflux permease
MAERASTIDDMPVWVVVLVAAMLAGIAMGVRQSMGLYVKPLSENLGLGREAFSMAIAIANIVWGLVAPFSGALSDRYGSGLVVVIGGLATAGGLFILYSAQSETHLLMSGVLLGIGVAGSGINALVGAVGRAARPERRTAAIAKLGIGSGIGVLIAIPYTHFLIETFGWQTSLAILAATALIIIPLAIPVSGRPRQVEPELLDLRLTQALVEAFQHPSFWLLIAGFFVCGFHVVFYAVHLPSFIADQGLDANVSVIALTVVGIGNLIGTYLSGWWGQRYSKRWGLSFIYSMRVVIFLAFLYLPITPTFVIAASALLGVFWLSTVPLTSSLVATFFGPKWMTMLYGIVFFSHQVGSFFGAWSAGYIFDRTQSYDMVWWISVALGLFAALIHIPIREAPVARLAGPIVRPAE